MEIKKFFFKREKREKSENVPVQSIVDRTIDSLFTY